MLHYIVINLRKPQGILFSIVSLAGHFHFGSRQSDVTFLPKQPHHRLCQLFIFFIAIEVARQSVGEQRGDAAAVACHHRRAKNLRFALRVGRVFNGTGHDIHVSVKELLFHLSF